jgi:hypothetical protein
MTHACRPKPAQHLDRSRTAVLTQVVGGTAGQSGFFPYLHAPPAGLRVRQKGKARR